MRSHRWLEEAGIEGPCSYGAPKDKRQKQWKEERKRDSFDERLKGFHEASTNSLGWPLNELYLENGTGEEIVSFKTALERLITLLEEELKAIQEEPVHRTGEHRQLIWATWAVVAPEFWR